MNKNPIYKHWAKTWAPAKQGIILNSAVALQLIFDKNRLFVQIIILL